MFLKVMREVRNTFWDGSRLRRKIVVNGGIIKLNSSFVPGNCVLLRGSQGETVYILHKNERSKANEFRIDDEVNLTFHTAYRLVVPQDFRELVFDIQEYVNKMPIGNMISEQFGEYRYTARQGDGRWETVYAKSLNKYRKMSDDLLNLTS